MQWKPWTAYLTTRSMWLTTPSTGSRRRYSSRRRSRTTCARLKPLTTGRWAPVPSHLTHFGQKQCEHYFNAFSRYPFEASKCINFFFSKVVQLDQKVRISRCAFRSGRNLKFMTYRYRTVPL